LIENPIIQRHRKYIARKLLFLVCFCFPTHSRRVEIDKEVKAIIIGSRALSGFLILSLSCFEVVFYACLCLKLQA
jgi:hypothetical protein